MPADAWEFHCDALSLVNGARTARLTRKAGDVLACLIRHRGRVVSQELLLREVWPNLHVTPDSRARVTSPTCAACWATTPRSPAVIETVRGRGYRLLGEIHAAPAGGEPAPLIRIAVLGLADRSLDARWTRLAQGLADDLAAELSRYSDLAVIGRASQPTPDAEPDVRRTAARLAARYLVTGKAEVLSERLRVLVTLIEGATGRVRWTRRIERPIAELPAVSEQVAAAIAASLGGILGEIDRVEREIVRRKPVASLDAYEHYLLGCDSCHENDRASTFKAIEHLKAAVAQDPGIARAFLVLAYAYGKVATCGWEANVAEWERRQRLALKRAYELDPRDPVILCEHAMILAAAGGATEALNLLERAIDLSENQAEACTILSCAVAFLAGDGPRALALVDQALSLNPDPPGWHKFYELRAAYFAGAYERCVAVATLSFGFPAEVHLRRPSRGRAGLGREGAGVRCGANAAFSDIRSPREREGDAAPRCIRKIPGFCLEAPGAFGLADPRDIGTLPTELPRAHEYRLRRGSREQRRP